MYTDEALATDDATIEMSVFRIQPVPIRTLVGRFQGVTAITRIWDDGDHLKCRLCQGCDASDEGVCTVQTSETILDSEAELYSLRGLRDETPRDRTAVGAS